MARPEGAPTSVPEPPREEIVFSPRDAVFRFVFSALLVTTLLATVVALLYGLFLLVASLTGRNPLALGELPGKWLVFWAIAWCFCALPCVPLSLFWSFTARTRQVWIEGERVHLHIGSSRFFFELSECSWQTCRGLVIGDSYGLYFGNAIPRLVIKHDAHSFGLGFTEEQAAKWCAYLEETSAWHLRKVQWPKAVATTLLLVIVGGLIGRATEPLFAWGGVPANLQWNLAFLGAIDGGIAALYRMQFHKRYYGRLSDPSWAGGMALLFGVLTIKVCGPFWIIVAANAVVGLLVGRFATAHNP